MANTEKIISEICPLITKEESELTESEKKRLTWTMLKTIQFMNKANILPTPTVFFRWFLVHCYLLHKGIKNPSYEALFNTYDSIEEKLEKVELYDPLCSENATVAANIKEVIRELIKLIDSVERLIQDAKARIDEAVKNLLDKEHLTPEDVKEFHETLNKTQKELITEIELIIERLQRVHHTLEETEEKIPAQLTECMKINVFRAIVKRLISRLINTGQYFTFMLIRANNWPSIQKLPKDVRIEFLNRVCIAIKSELRSIDYVSCFEEEGLFAVAIRNVGLKIAHRVAKRIQDTLEGVSILHKDGIVYSTFAFALIEGKPHHTFDSLVETGKKILSLCDTKENSIKSEVDLVGKEL